MPPAVWVCGAWSVGLAAGVTLFPGQPILGVATLCAGAAIGIMASVVRPAVPFLALMAALLGLARAELPPQDPAPARAALAVAGQSGQVTGVVADDPRPISGGLEVLVTPRQIVTKAGVLPPVGNLLILLRGAVDVSLGDRVQAYGKLELPAQTPGFDRRAYMAQQGAYLDLRTTQVNTLAGGSAPLRFPGWLRQQYQRSIAILLPQPHAALLLGIVLGIREGIPADLQQALISTGLVHLLVLSGLKVSIFARLALAALEPALGRLATIPALILVGLYALVGGATPSALRSAAMGALVLIAGRLGRQTHVWTSLSVVGAAMLAWRPDYAWDVGFQLSFVGTIAIVLLTPYVEVRLRWLPSRFREPLAVTVAAQIGTVPLMAADFHVVSLSAPVANALILPLLPALVAAGILVAPLAVLPAVGRMVALPIAGSLAFVEQVARVGASLPWSTVSVPQFPVWAGMGYFAALAGPLVAARNRGRRRWVGIGITLGAPLLIGLAELGLALHPQPSVAVLAVGDGQAVLLTGPSGFVLVDGGGSPARLTGELGQVMPPWQRSLSGIILTAPAATHIAGLAGFDRSTPVVIVPGVEPSATSFRNLVLADQAAGASVLPLAAGRSFQLAGLDFQVLAPQITDPRDQVGVGYIGFRTSLPGGHSFCDLSDLDVDGQTVAAVHLNGTCDYLLLAGGGKSVPSPDLMLRARPQVLIASSSGGQLARGLPTALVRRTDQEGTIVLPL